MHKIILVWATLAAMLVAGAHVSLAQSKRPSRSFGHSRPIATAVPDDDTDAAISEVEKRGLGLEFESISDDDEEDFDESPIRAVSDDDSQEDTSDEQFKIFPKKGRTQLTAAQEPVLVMSEPDPGLVEPGPELSASCPVTCCCAPLWQHRCTVWGEYLFLRPRGADVTYASTVDGTLATSVPLGDRSVAAFNYDSGFRAGVGYAINECSSVTGNYTWFRATSSDFINLPGGGGSFIAAETVHPNTVNVAADSLSASALHDITLQAADLNYKGLLYGDDNTALNFLVGVKYARLEQEFGATYSILGTTNVNTNVNFSGVGPRFGYEVERRVNQCGLLGYSKGAVNFLAGSCSADFLQTNVFTGIQAQTGQQDSRIVTIPELEVGAGWQSCSGCVRFTMGYYITSWFNMLTTPEYLSSVRTTQNTFENQIKTLTMDGLTVRGEFRF